MIFNKIWNRHRRLIFILILFSAPIVPLFLVKVTLPRVHVYDNVSAWVVHPIAEAGRNLTGGVGVLWNRYLALVNTSRENDLLRRESQELHARILQLEEFESENKRLRDMLSMPDAPTLKKVAGKIIGQDSSGESLTYVLNIGSDSGLKVRMPVVTAQGVVGTLSRVYKHSSIFVAVVDPSHDVDGIITRSRARFIVEGRGTPLVGRLKYLDRAEDVRVGDLVVTSGLDGTFPKGLKVGNIVRIDRPRTGVSQEAELRPIVDFGHLEEVLVLLYDGKSASAAGDLYGVGESPATP